MNLNSTKEPCWYGEAAQSIAPIGIIMAFFMLIYTIWFVFAWGIVGWILFVISLLLSVFLSVKSIQNIKHAKSFKNNTTPEGKRIGKAMGILSGVSYGLLWLAVIFLIIFSHYTFIMPTVTLIIGVHFLPQAKIMNRKIDYFVAPLPIASAIIAFVLAINYDASWASTYAIASIGGALATSIYGVYTLRTYKALALEHGVND